MDTAILQALRSNALMRRVSADELEYLASHARVLGYLPGTFIFHESQPRRVWGLVLKGRVTGDTYLSDGISAFRKQGKP